ncbi:MAG: hypothetical protein U0936_28410 [Planctomycetaceae bacterium]
MIHEYALDPEAAFTKDGFWTLLKDFGVSHGRVLMECPSASWSKSMENALIHARNELGAVAFSRLTERWAELRRTKAIARRRIEYGNVTSPTWVERALAEHRGEPFRAILGSRANIVPREVLTKEQIDLGDERWVAETQKIIDRDAIAIAGCVGPIGRISEHLLIIDPYFNEDSKWQQSLTAILNTSQAADGHFQRIEVHTREFNSEERSLRRRGPTTSKREILQTELAKTLPRKLPANVRVEFFVWQERDGGDRYHRRYVLTERGGIYVEGGLDRGNEGQTTDVGLLAENVFVQRWREYQRETAAFDPVGEPFVIKSCR